MLNLAVKAGLPLIALQTTDVMNASDVIEHITGKKPLEVNLSKGLPSFTEGSVYYKQWVSRTPPDPKLCRKIYEKCVSKGCTMIFMNMKTIPPEFHDIGLLPTPQTLVRKVLTDAFDNEKVVESIMPALGGLTLKEIGEVARLTMARDGSLTASGINSTRKEIVSPVRGLELVDPGHDYYLPDPRLEKFAESEREWFLNSPDHRLRPRGFMWTSKPGCGKSSGSKYIARKWGVPLFRLDASVQSKYVGESEMNLKNALQQVDHEEPCILLIDEVEKFFRANVNNDSGVTSKMLGSLLWWLQEHRSRVFVIMTCNNRKILPPELYREGRVDGTWDFTGLTKEQSIPFMKNVAESFGKVKMHKSLEHQATAMFSSTKEGTLSHSFLVQAVYRMLKAGDITIEKGEQK